MAEDPRKTLEDTTRYDPAKVERRIMDAWLAAGYFHPPAEDSDAYRINRGLRGLDKAGK